MDNEKNKGWRQRVKGTKGYELLSAFIKSAAVGFLFAVLCFVYDVYHDSEQDKQLEESIDKLAKIEQSLSTRYLGIFPEYISEIGVLFDDVSKTDSIVIFEDVLYYGIKSRPKEFFNLNKKLFDHAMAGGSITVAYYDFERSLQRPVSSDIFHKMIVESRINAKYHAVINERRRDEIEKRRKESEQRVFSTPFTLREVDSALCQEYFEATRDEDLEKFKKDVDSYLDKSLIMDETPDLSAAELATNQMCIEIDSVKQTYLGNGKPVEDILFSDYEMMYRKISEVIVKYYSKYGIDLVPLDEYLTMSCWLVRKTDRKEVKAVLAFPSKYSTDEIGFYSQDEAFSKYIGTMLEGVKQNRQTRQNN